MTQSVTFSVGSIGPLINDCWLGASCSASPELPANPTLQFTGKASGTHFRQTASQDRSFDFNRSWPAGN
jgi:hypothetical protein